MGIIIEHFGGDFPLWLAPIQVAILPVAEAHVEYAKKVMGDLKMAGLRGELKADNLTLGKRIREAEMQKIPYVLVVGAKEMEAGTVAVRSRKNGDLGTKKTSDLTEALKMEVRDKK